jgi:rRNA biogenesis protein RRP5
MTKNKSLTSLPTFWLNYATFLLTTLNQPTAARALLQRATQSLHTSHHRLITSKFALLEFHSPNGDPERGRTVFEGLISTWPKRGDLWDMWVDAEMRLLQEGREAGGIASVRGLFERMVEGKMKPRRAKFVFKRWMEWEEKLGDKGQKEKVVGLAREWVEKHAQEKEIEGTE